VVVVVVVLLPLLLPWASDAMGAVALQPAMALEPSASTLV
jgi:hypothetical protein